MLKSKNLLGLIVSGISLATLSAEGGALNISNPYYAVSVDTEKGSFEVSSK